MILPALPALRCLAGITLLAGASLSAGAGSCALPTEDALRFEAPTPVLSLDEWMVARPQRPRAFLLADLPRVLVLAQADLRVQGETFGRMVAFMEKAGLPRTRVPTQPELLQWLRRSGQRLETLTLGNNLDSYRLARFYNLAGWQGEPLTSAETELLASLLRWRVLATTDHGYVQGPGAAMVITFPLASEVAGCEPCKVAEADSLAVLGHEYQHARYSLDPALQHYTEWYWFNRVPLLQRLRVLRQLERRGYDTTQQSLLLDEFHAFLSQSEGRAPVLGHEADEAIGVFRELRQDFFNTLAAFEAGKGPVARPPLALQPSIQGE